MKRVAAARVSDGAVIVGVHDEVCPKMHRQVPVLVAVAVAVAR